MKQAGYNYNYWFSAQRKRDTVESQYYQKLNLLIVVYGTGIESMDFEGRNIRADFEGVLSYESIYYHLEQTRPGLNISLNTWICLKTTYNTKLKKEVSKSYYLWRL